MIRFRIAALFSLLTGLTTVLLMLLVYYNTKQSLQDYFFEDLRAKARLEGQFMLEKDEMDIEIYQDIITEHLVKLPREEEYVIALTDTTEAISKGLLTHDIILSTLENETHYFTVKKRQWATLHYPDNQGDFIILVSAVDEKGQQELSALRKSMFSSLIITMLLQFIAGWAFANTVTNPLRQIGEQLKRINASELSSRIDIPNKKDELGQMVEMLNEMLDRLQNGIEIQKKFISNASHELKTPLTVIMGEAEVILRKDREKEEYVKSIGTIRKQGEKLTEILSDLIQLMEVSSGGSQYFEKTRFRIEDVILDAQARMFEYSGRNLIEVDYGHHSEEDYELEGNRRWLGIVFSNLLKNALKFSDFQPVKLHTELIAYKSGKAIRVNVTDSGVGIPEEDLASLRNPFFRASNVSHIVGHGIGLTIVDQIIRLHNGEMQISSIINEGTTISILLPLVSDQF